MNEIQDTRELLHLSGITGLKLVSELQLVLLHFVNFQHTPLGGLASSEILVKVNDKSQNLRCNKSIVMNATFVFDLSLYVFVY